VSLEIATIFQLLLLLQSFLDELKHALLPQSLTKKESIKSDFLMMEFSEKLLWMTIFHGKMESDLTSPRSIKSKTRFGYSFLKKVGPKYADPMLSALVDLKGKL